MAIIRHRRNSTTGVAPSAGALLAGEWAINTADGKAFLKTDAGLIKTIDMGSNVYDPSNKKADVFNLANMTGTLPNSVLDTLTTRINGIYAITVGPSGANYTTLGAALAAVSRRAPDFVSRGYTVTITLLTGFQLAEQIIVDSIDLGFVTILSQAAEVRIDHTAIAASGAMFTEESTVPAIGGRYNAVLPVIGVCFKYDSSATAMDGIAVHYNSSVMFLPGAGVRNPRRGLQVLYGSKAICYMSGLTQGGAGTGAGTVTGVKFDGASNRALHVAFGSFAGLARSDFSYSTNPGESVYVIWNSQVDLYQSKATNCTGTAFYCRDGSTMNIRECTGANSGKGIHALHNATVNARSKEGGDANPWIGDSYKNCGSYAVHASYNSRIDAAQIDATGCTDRAVHASNNSTINFWGGIANNSTNDAVSAVDGSTITAYNAQANNSGRGFVALSGSTVTAEGGQAKSCSYGCYAAQASTLHIEGVDARYCTTAGIAAFEACTVQAKGALVSGISGTVVPTGITANRASSVNAHGVQADYCNISFLAADGATINAVSSTTVGAVTWGYQWLRGSQMVCTSTSGTVARTINTLSVDGVGYR